MKILMATIAECYTIIRIASVFLIPVVAVQVMYNHTVFMYTADHALVIIAVHN